MFSLYASTHLRGFALAALLVILVGCSTTTLATHPTPTSQATSLPTATPLGVTPTASPTPTLSFPTIAQSWGANAAQTTFTITNMTFDSITPDGTRLLGVTQPNQQVIDMGWIDTTTQHFTTFSQYAIPTMAKPLQWHCCQTDGRYYVGDDEGSGGYEGPSTIWSYDALSSKMVDISPASQGGIDYAVSQGYLAVGSYAFGTSSINIYSLAMNTKIYSIPVASGNYVHLAFSWPYLAYFDFPQESGATAVPNAAGVVDLRTDTTVSLPQLAGAQAELIGDTLFYLGSTGSTITLYELDHVMVPGSQAVELGSFPIGSGNAALTGANARLVNLRLQDTDRTSASAIAWDRAERHFVLLGTSTSPSDICAILSGSYLLVDTAASGLSYSSECPSGQIAIYNTATLPVK